MAAILLGNIKNSFYILRYAITKYAGVTNRFK